MNLRLVFTISLLGFLMAVIAVYLAPSAIELFLWLAVFLVCAFLIARYTDEGYFMSGLCTGILICTWIAIADTLLFGRYYITHRGEVNLISTLGVTSSVHSSLLILGPAAGLFAGCFIGLFALIAAKIMKPRTI